MKQSEFIKLLTLFRIYKQKLVYILKINEHNFGIDIDISCNPDCLNETGKLITICGMLSNKIKEILSKEEYEDFAEKLIAVKQVYIVLKALNPEEEFIINEKYLHGYEKHDSDIYILESFPHGKTKYYEYKISAWNKILGIIS